MIERKLEEFIIGSSAVMRRLRERIARIGPSRLPVLILGPTGAGKELVARGLHLASGRSGAFVTCNVSALNPSLFESAVFGHVRGAFTGAVRDCRGHLADANGGTMFFDEIGGLAPECQPKLLRALDGYGFRPIGASQDRQSDFRLISATNDDLSGMVRTGRFRADLWYRLAGVTIAVPPLSARLDDLPALTEHVLARRGQTEIQQSVSAAALEILRLHEWTGNVRELSLTIERAALFADGSLVDATHVEAAIECASLAMRSHGLRKATYDQLIAALSATGGDVQQAARALGISRPTIYRLLQSFGLAARRWRNGEAGPLMDGRIRDPEAVPGVRQTSAAPSAQFPETDGRNL